MFPKGPADPLPPSDDCAELPRQAPDDAGLVGDVSYRTLYRIIEALENPDLNDAKCFRQIESIVREFEQNDVDRRRGR